jgi:cobalt-zinc-cadmium efflux system protein
VTSANERRVFWVMVLTSGFMIVEAAGGLLSGSLALLADAGHMLADSAALTLAWFAFRIARKSPDPKRSYGYHRFQILAAFANGLALFAIAAWIIIEAALRLANPVEIEAGPMMAVAAMGLLVNIAGLWILSRAEQDNLNIKGAALHIMGDLLGSGAAIAAAGVILITGWMPIDPILSVLVSVLILRGAWGLVRRSSHILLQGVPEGIDAARIGAALGDISGVTDVHDVHAWSLTNERPIVTLHAVMEQGADQTEVLHEIHSVLRLRFGIEHATVQLEYSSIECVPCEAGS